MSGGRPTTARGIPPPPAEFDAQNRVTFASPNMNEHAIFNQPMSASRLTDSGGFNSSASFSNYSYSDSYEDYDADAGYRSPPVGSSADSYLRYSYSGRRGYGYQPQPSIRASYESSGYGSRDGGVYDSRDSRGVYDSRDRQGNEQYYSDEYYSSRDGGVYYENRSGKTRGNRPLMFKDSRDGDVYDSRGHILYSSYDSQDPSNYTPYSSRDDHGVYESRDSHGQRPNYYRGSTSYGPNRHSADYYGSSRYSGSYRSGAFYSSVDDEVTPAGSYDYSSYRGSSEYRRSGQRVRSSLAPSSQAEGGARRPWPRASVRRSGFTARSSCYSATTDDGVPPPIPGFRRAWEKTRDEFYEAAREICINEDGTEHPIPSWLRRAMERKEEENKAENKKLRSSEAKWARRLDATEKKLAEEQQHLKAIAEERRALEKQRARLELHHRVKDLVPATTYNPEPPPHTFEWNYKNCNQMHELCKKRYEASWAQKQREKRAAVLEQAQAQAIAEQEACKYDEEYYYLEKGARKGTGLLSSPTWEDVQQLKERRRRHLAVTRCGPQGRTILIK